MTTSSGRSRTPTTWSSAPTHPINDWLIIHTKQAAYRTYVIGARVPKGSVPHGLYWDTPVPTTTSASRAAEDKTGHELDYDVPCCGEDP